MAKFTFIGDTHIADEMLAKMVADSPLDSTIIQVGDIGFWPEWAYRYVRLPRPIYFIEGNHDHIPSFADIKEPTAVWPDLIYVPRGTVLELEGKRIGFLGGATSVDRRWRQHNTGFNGWYDGEDVTLADVDRLIANGPVDLLVTHCPPNCTIERNFERPGFLSAFGLPTNWVDSSALEVERAWKSLGEPPLFCGHMHRVVKDGNVRILNINEVLTLEI